MKESLTSAPGMLLLAVINVASIAAMAPWLAHAILAVFTTVELLAYLNLWRMNRLPWQQQ